MSVSRSVDDTGTIRKVAIVGRGNVALHLGKAFGNVADVTILNPRGDIRIPQDADLVLVAVSDSAIAEVASRLPRTKALVTHTSGSVDIAALRDSHDRCGVFYPLQTFSKEKKLDYSVIPFFIEADDPADGERLVEFARRISENVTYADSDRRRRLHLASVFACNFVNRLYDIAWQIMEESGLPPEFLTPLVEETASKIAELPPFEAQTGPAVRKDMEVIGRHLEMLASKPEFKEIYRIMSESIMDRKND